MGRRDGCCERDAAEGLDGVSVELFNVNLSLLIRDCKAHLGDLHGCFYAGLFAVVMKEYYLSN